MLVSTPEILKSREATTAIKKDNSNRVMDKGLGLGFKTTTKMIEDMKKEYKVFAWRTRGRK